MGDVHRTAWILEQAGRRGIRVGIDMCQNLADPPQAVDDVVAYVEAVRKLTSRPIMFLEEAIGPDSPEGFKELRSRVDIEICGGEIITTPKEMINRIKDGVYDFVVHAWGGAVAIMASYHAAFAAGGELVEYPMLDFPLGRDMIGDQGKIEKGRLIRPTAPGIGVILTPEMEDAYPFDETAVYSCMLHDWGPPPDSYWK
jgi:L-alanine-DL-glutamate epimerase-like enolase superfamily enzyme